MTSVETSVPTAIGVDVGGTKIAAGLVRNGQVLASMRRPTDAARGVEAVVAEVAAMVRDLVDSAGMQLVGAGVAVAGQVDAADGSVRYAPNLAWRDFPLAARLRAATGLPVAALNDVHAAAYGEYLHGAGRGYGGMVAMFVGTGIGGGVISGGRLLTGCGGSAGEIGHVTVEVRGPLCHCGNRGCMEALAGGWGIARAAREAVEADSAGGARLLALAGGDANAVTGAHVSAAAAEGDALARRLLAHAGEALAAGAVSVVNAFDPCALVLGGGVIDGHPAFVEVVRTALAQRALTERGRSLPVLRPALGEHAGVVGAAEWLLHEGPPALP